jgi:hypothetical protein
MTYFGKLLVIVTGSMVNRVGFSLSQIPKFHSKVSFITCKAPPSLWQSQMTYLGKLLVIVVKQAEVDGGKPIFQAQARLSKNSSICP